LSTHGREYARIIGVAGVLLILYPAYIFVLKQLSPTAQGFLSLLLPLTKVITQNVMTRKFVLNSDIRAEEIVFTTEVFSSLFVAFTMQNSSSLLPVMLFTILDVVRAGVTLYDIVRFADKLERAHKRTRSLRSTPGASGTADPPFCHEASSSRNFTTRSGQLLGVLRAVLALVCSEDIRRVSRVRGPGSSTIVETLSIVPPMANSSLVRVAMTKIAPHPSRHTMSSSMPDASVSSRVNRQQQLVVQLGLRFLFMTEYIVLVKFVDVVIPTIYGESFDCICVLLPRTLTHPAFSESALYLLMMAHLNNRQFYPQLAAMDSEHQRQLVTNMLVYAALQLAILVTLQCFVWWRLRFSLVTQLAFVLERQWPTVQSRLVLWVVYVVEGTLAHCGECVPSVLLVGCSRPNRSIEGTDYTFRFAWLHPSPAADSDRP
jgi:hypothetical protein